MSADVNVDWVVLISDDDGWSYKTIVAAAHSSVARRHGFNLIAEEKRARARKGRDTYFTHFRCSAWLLRPAKREPMDMQTFEAFR